MNTKTYKFLGAIEACARVLLVTTAIASCVAHIEAQSRPNVLIAVSDDQSYPHASAYGCREISTPAIDRVASTGVLFNNAFTPAPGCSPMRAAFLTGRNIWQIENAGTHASYFPKQYEVFPDRLEKAGYFVGYTGKGWGPGNWQISGRTRNPAGTAFSSKTLSPPFEGIRSTDYAGNFELFLQQRPKDKPFCFWYGASEPHRRFEKGSGVKSGKRPEAVKVPSFLPDRPEIRSDILDYYVEIEWFDRHLGRMLDLLQEAGELENTLVIVTSDNGMAFPRAKANVYEFGIHMPLAVAWPKRFPSNRVVDDLVNLIDVTATIYAATGVEGPTNHPLAGRDLMNVLGSSQSGMVDPSRDAIFSGRERHSSVRYNSLGYPQRCIRTKKYLYIRNFRPERWPAGAPQKYGAGGYAKGADVVNKILGPMHAGYHDIDGCPSLSFLVEHHDDAELGKFLDYAVSKRPAEELFDIRKDPGCLSNLAYEPELASVKRDLSGRLIEYLATTRDPRVVDAAAGDIFETYPRVSSLRWFPEPDWAKRNPDLVPSQEWLEERRPK